MAKFVVLSVLFLITLLLTVYAHPANDVSTKSVSQNEIYVNLPTEISKIENDGKIITTENNSSITVNIEPKNQSAFSRIIDDVFQIPITVLQSVSKLLTNTFSQKN